MKVHTRKGNPLFRGIFLAIPVFVVLPSCSPLEPGPPPEQPISFDHRIHTADYEINCYFCHRYPERSPVAGVPAVRICMNCHELIAADKPEVIKLIRYWEDQEPIPWIKVYDLPDFVRFTHKRHIRAGIECGKCHGPVETMKQIRKVYDLTMGWCLRCHKKENAETDCFACHY